MVALEPLWGGGPQPYYPGWGEPLARPPTSLLAVPLPRKIKLPAESGEFYLFIEKSYFIPGILML